MMRRFSALWLALSLVVNAALMIVCLMLASNAGEQRSAESAAVSSVEKRRASASGAVDVSGLDAEVVAKIRDGDEATLRELLLACGMEPKAVRRLVGAALQYRFEAEQVAAMMRKRGSGWWKEQPDWWNYPEQKEIRVRENAELERLVGALPERSYPWEEERWDFLPAGKRKALQTLDRDYEEMEVKLPPQPWLPHEQEMYSKLKDEKRRDLEALLSREELAEYDFREEADYFARDLDKYGITDAELRVLWRADKEHDAAVKELSWRYGTRDPFASPGASDWPQEAREEERRLDEAYQAKKREVLGTERIKRGDREADGSFKEIVKVTEKFGLGRQKAEEIYAVLERAKVIMETEAEGMNTVDHAKLRDAAWEEIGGQVSSEALMLLKKSVVGFHYWLTPASR